MKLEDDKFNEFMLQINDGIIRDERGNISKNEPMKGICTKEIGGMTLEGLLKNSSTKDVNIVKTKIDFLTKLMCEYFGIELVHHRVYNDAYATAQAFIEMIKLNKGMPEYDV